MQESPDTTSHPAESTNEPLEPSLHSRRDQWAEEYVEAVENGFKGSEEDYYKLKDARVREQLRQMEETPPLLGEGCTAESLKGISMTKEVARILALEEEIKSLKQRMDDDRKEQTKQHGQFLMLLGDTLLKQGQHIVQSASTTITTAKMVPHEETPNDGTVRVIVDKGDVTIYRSVDNTLVPHRDNQIDMDTVKAKLEEYGVTEGNMVSMNIYLTRG